MVSKLKKFFFIVLVASLLLQPLLAGAARLDQLYEAEVPAAGRDAAARDAALGVALEEVLQRLTGSRAALQTATAAKLLEPPGRFVEQYRFNELPASDDQPKRLMLWAQFDGVSLSRELRRAGLPYWGAERPDVLVWLAVDDRGQRYLLSETGGQAAADAMRQSAQRRGLPTTLPLLDLEDQRALQFTDVWGGFFGRIETASQRYQPQVILTGKLERDNAQGVWRTEWQIIDQGNRQSWSSRADSLESAVDAGLTDAAAWLAQRYAVIATQAGIRVLVVDGVRNLDDYARVSRYLASLSPVDRVDVAGVTDQEVEFNLKLSADERNLQQLIALGRVLQRTDDPTAWRFHLHP
jgi:hypothetical protein